MAITGKNACTSIGDFSPTCPREGTSSFSSGSENPREGVQYFNAPTSNVCCFSHHRPFIHKLNPVLNSYPNPNQFKVAVSDQPINKHEAHPHPHPPLPLLPILATPNSNVDVAAKIAPETINPRPFVRASFNNGLDGCGSITYNATLNINSKFPGTDTVTMFECIEVLVLWTQSVRMELIAVAVPGGC